MSDSFSIDCIYPCNDSVYRSITPYFVNGLPLGYYWATMVGQWLKGVQLLAVKLQVGTPSIFVTSA